MKRTRENVLKTSLRERAEAQLKMNAMEIAVPLTDVEIKRLAQELQVYKIEVEMQNQELMRMQTELDAARVDYRKIYDFSPTGYIAFDRCGVIRKANLNAASLLGMERSRLINRQFALFVSEEFRLTFKAFLKRVFVSKARETCELTLLKGEDRIPVIINATVSEDGKECLAAMTDVTELKKLENSLRESEHYYRTIFENSGTAMLIVDEDTTVTQVNAEFEHMLQYGREVVEGRKSWTEYIPEENLERLLGYHRLRRIDAEAAPGSYNTKVISKSGQVRDVHLTVSMIPGTKKSVASYLDITLLKETEKRLRESNFNYEALLNHTGVAIIKVDVRGNFLRVNKTFVELTGFRQEELADMTVMDLVHPDYIPQTRDLIAKLTKGEIDSFEQEMYYIRKDDTPCWGEVRCTPFRDEQGRLLSAVVAVIDRTEWKQMEEALARSEALHRSLFENASIGMFHTNFEPGRFLRVNSAYAAMLGYDSPEDLMSTVTNVASLHVDPQGHAAILSTLKKQEWFYSEYPRFRKDGSIMIGKVAIRRVLNPEGRIDYIEGIVEDVTERKKAEEERKKYTEEITDLYENAPCGYHSLAPDGTIIRMNDTELAWLGYSRDEVIGKMKYTDLLPPEELDLFWQTFPLLKKRGWMSNIDGKLIRKDGSILPILLNATAVHDENGNYLMSRSSVFDNTEQKKAEEALLEKERELRTKAQNLAEANTTMKVLLNTMEKDQEELKERFLDNIKAQVFPYLEKLKKTELTDVQKGFLKTAEACLDDIASPFVQKLTSSYLNLTKKELQIAALIKEGKATKEIAELLNAKQRVVEFHRENIRKKLGLNNKKGNLAILLRSFS